MLCFESKQHFKLWIKEEHNNKSSPDFSLIVVQVPPDCETSDNKEPQQDSLRVLLTYFQS